MKVRFVKLSPTRNMTVLVTSEVPREKQLELGAKIIKPYSVGGEQAGFLEKAENPRAEARLQMAAGEFCGNGTMSAAAYIAGRDGLAAGCERDVALEVSGADDVLICHVKRTADGFEGTVGMPLPLAVKREEYTVCGKKHTLTAVYLSGIRHVIMPREELGDFRKELEDSLDSLKEQITDDAFGIVVFDEKAMRIDPLVAVKSEDSVCWESGCGSGSEAVGVYLADRDGRSADVDIIQPGGTINVKVKYDNGIRSVSITGTVTVVAEGEAYV